MGTKRVKRTRWVPTRVTDGAGGFKESLIEDSWYEDVYVPDSSDTSSPSSDGGSSE